jgi:hypothetical protein
MADEALALDHALDCLRVRPYFMVIMLDIRGNTANLLQPPNPKSTMAPPVPVPSKNLALELPGRAQSIPNFSGRCRWGGSQ